MITDLFHSSVCNQELCDLTIKSLLNVGEGPFHGSQNVAVHIINICLFYIQCWLLNESEQVEAHPSLTPAQYRYPPVPARLSGQRKENSSLLKTSKAQHNVITYGFSSTTSHLSHPNIWSTKLIM